MKLLYQTKLSILVTLQFRHGLRVGVER